MSKTRMSNEDKETRRTANNIVEEHQGQALAGMVEVTTAVIEETIVEGRLIEPPHNRTLTGTIIKTRGTNKPIKTNR